MPNRFTRGTALVGRLSVDADLTVLKDLQVNGDATFTSSGSVTAPAGGDVIDVEARAAIVQIIAILEAVGLAD